MGHHLSDIDALLCSEDITAQQAGTAFCVLPGTATRPPSAECLEKLVNALQKQWETEWWQVVMKIVALSEAAARCIKAGDDDGLLVAVCGRRKAIPTDDEIKAAASSGAETGVGIMHAVRFKGLWFDSKRV